jgi:hypothetical protein
MKITLTIRNTTRICGEERPPRRTKGFLLNLPQLWTVSDISENTRCFVYRFSDQLTSLFQEKKVE